MLTFYEGKVCDVVIKYLETREGMMPAFVRPRTKVTPRLSNLPLRLDTNFLRLSIRALNLLKAICRWKLHQSDPRGARRHRTSWRGV
jgi:hypothetical protein